MSFADLMGAKPFDRPPLPRPDNVIELPVRVSENARRPDPLIVALYGGSGTGKSTTAAILFGILKQAGYSVELVHEVAKDFTWEERWATLNNQPYVVCKQLRNYDRCYGKVDAIITDTSSLLGLIYGNEGMKPEVSRAFRDFIVADWKARRTLNVFLKRDPARGYDTAGRKESEQEALTLDARIEQLLFTLNIPMMTLQVDKTSNDYAHEILEEVKRQLDGKTKPPTSSAPPRRKWSKDHRCPEACGGYCMM